MYPFAGAKRLGNHLNQCFRSPRPRRPRGRLYIRPLFEEACPGISTQGNSLRPIRGAKPLPQTEVGPLVRAAAFGYKNRSTSSKRAPQARSL
jgi:hypothetical protein